MNLNLHRVDVHPKNSIAIMALDHSRLGLKNKFLGNKSGRIFCVRQVYFTKSCQQVWGRGNQPFTLFIHHIWGETVPSGAVFIIQTSNRRQHFTTLNTNCTHYWAAPQAQSSIVGAEKRPPGGGKTRGSGTEKRCSHKCFINTNKHRGKTHWAWAQNLTSG